MKKKESIVRQIISKSFWRGLLLVVVATLTLEATSLIQYYFSQKGLTEEATKRAEAQLESTHSEIMDVINRTETALRNNVWIAQWCLDNTDSLPRVCERIVNNNPEIMGSTIALIPGYNRKEPLCAPYIFKDGSSLYFRSLATEEYDYPSKEWFAEPVKLGSSYWSEPYVDTDGGEIPMTTYSLPIKDKDGAIAAVLTGDVSLDWLTDLFGNIKIYPHATSMLISRTGRFLVGPTQELLTQRTVDEVAGQAGDSTAFRALNREMLAGNSGYMPLSFNGVKTHVYYAPIERTGWSMGLLIPDDDIYGEIRRISMFVNLLQVLGVLMLLLILRSLFRNQVKFMKLDEKEQRMEGELHIASDIQMSMIPNTFPPFPERHDLDMSAAIIPAKEVGGDLYDYYIRDEKLFFCIGDVSGKGVPASLVMATTRSMFRTISAHDDSPGGIITSINNSMTDMNQSNMFVTFFCGVLDLGSGLLRYCNAGHNPPVILMDAIRKLPVESNLPLGIIPGFDFKEQEAEMVYDDALFLYTDGLTEAENQDHEQFGEYRMEAALHGRKSAQEHLDNISGKVKEFVGDAPQSDDLTMLFIHYLAGKRKYRITFGNDIHQVSRLEGWMETIAEDAGLDASTLMSVNLALEEAATNVILYAYPEGEKGWVELSAVSGDGKLRFILSDRGKPFDPTAAPSADITASVENRSIGGLGIHLVRTIMDSVEYERKDGKNILTMTKII